MMVFRRQSGTTPGPLALTALVLYAAGWVGFPLLGALKPSRAADPHAMTVGCAEASCCTARCYLDENGVHHCVPNEGASCDCGLSSKEAASRSVPALEVATLPRPDELSISLRPVANLHPLACSCLTVDLSVPSPPPKGGPRSSAS